MLQGKIENLVKIRILNKDKMLGVNHGATSDDFKKLNYLVQDNIKSFNFLYSYVVILEGITEDPFFMEVLKKMRNGNNVVDRFLFDIIENKIEEDVINELNFCAILKEAVDKQITNLVKLIPSNIQAPLTTKIEDKLEGILQRILKGGSFVVYKPSKQSVKLSDKQYVLHQKNGKGKAIYIKFNGKWLTAKRAQSLSLKERESSSSR